MISNFSKNTALNSDMKCDTCGREVQVVKRVVIRENYDRTLSRAVYNCPDCYQKKAKNQAAEK